MLERLKLTLPAGVSLQLSASPAHSPSLPHSHVQRRRYQTIRPPRCVPLGLRKRTKKGNDQFTSRSSLECVSRCLRVYVSRFVCV